MYNFLICGKIMRLVYSAIPGVKLLERVNGGGCTNKKSGRTGLPLFDI